MASLSFAFFFVLLAPPLDIGRSSWKLMLGVYLCRVANLFFFLRGFCSIKEGFSRLLDDSLKFALERDIEMAFWKCVHRITEEYRKSLKKVRWCLLASFLLLHHPPQETLFSHTRSPPRLLLAETRRPCSRPSSDFSRRPQGITLDC